MMSFEHFGQIRAGNAMFINRSTYFIDNAANNTLVAGATKIGTCQFDAFFQFLAGVITRMGYQNNFSIQCGSDILIQFVSKRLLLNWHQTFNHHDFGTTLLNMSLIKRNNLFQQYCTVV
eukprot:RCo009465